MKKPTALVLLAALLVSGCANKSTVPLAPAIKTDRLLAREAWLDLEVDDEEDVEPATAKARAAVETRGGYVVWERGGSLLVRVPEKELTDTLDDFAKLGEVERRELAAEDVTEESVDLDVRIDNARRMQARLRDLVARAEKVEDVLAVEKELARVTEELERLEAKKRLLGERTETAAIHLEIRNEITPGPVGWVFYAGFVAVRWLFVWD